MRAYTGAQGIDKIAAVAIKAKRITFLVAIDEAVFFGIRRIDDEPWRVGIAHQEVEIDLVVAQQFVDEREDKQAISTRLDTQPLICDRRIAGADRIDRDELGLVRSGAALQMTKPNLDWIAVVI